MCTAFDRLGSKRKSGLLHSRPQPYPIPLETPPSAPPSVPPSVRESAPPATTRASALSSARASASPSPSAPPLVTMNEESQLSRYLPVAASTHPVQHPVHCSHTESTSASVATSSGLTSAPTTCLPTVLEGTQEYGTEAGSYSTSGAQKQSVDKKTRRKQKSSRHVLEVAAEENLMSGNNTAGRRRTRKGTKTSKGQ